MKYKYTRKECNKEIETIKRIFSGSQIMPGGWLETVTQYLHATQLMLLAQKEDRKELLTDKSNRVMTNKKNKSSSISSEIDCVQTPITESDHIEEIDKSLEHLWFGKQINSLIRNQKKLYQYIKEKKMKKTYDKFGKLRTIKEVNKINKYLGYCSKCGEPVEINGNSMADGAFKVKHKVCKQKTDWEKEFDSRDLGCCGGDNCPHYVCIYDEKTGNNVGTNHNEVLKDFISQLLKTQREEIIKVIKEHRPVFFKGDLHSLLSQDEVMRVREVLRIEMLEELGVDCKEIRERLKQITNLKENKRI